MPIRSTGGVEHLDELSDPYVISCYQFFLSFIISCKLTHTSVHHKTNNTSHFLPANHTHSKFSCINTEYVLCILHMNCWLAGLNGMRSSQWGEDSWNFPSRFERTKNNLVNTQKFTRKNPQWGKKSKRKSGAIPLRRDWYITRSFKLSFLSVIASYEAEDDRSSFSLY